MTTLEEKIKTLRGKNAQEWNDLDHIYFDNYQNLEKLKKEAEQNAIKEFFLQKERLKIKAGLNKTIFQADIEEMDTLKTILQDQKRSADPKYALFVTINPKDNELSGYEELNKRVEKCLAKYWITEYAYCYEQRSTDAESIHGLHTHILITRGTHKPSHCEREIRSTFSPLCGNSKHINIQYKKKEWINDKLEYMLGNKTGTDTNGSEKDLKIPIDIIMREKLNIQPIVYRGYEDFFSKV